MLANHRSIAALEGNIAPEAHGPVPIREQRKPGEVTITRRLFRSGESEYLIDGRPARLRDIQDIFMGTGLGPESYAIIEQGRIGQILSSKPQDRRAVIEEAAGITKYKIRRRLAEAKLESARQNLARVFDILEEVTRQVNSLKRQAAKAKRYQELKGELESQLRTVLAGRFLTLQTEAKSAAAALTEATAALKDITVQAADLDSVKGKPITSRGRRRSAKMIAASTLRISAASMVTWAAIAGFLHISISEYCLRIARYSAM